MSFRDHHEKLVYLGFLLLPCTHEAVCVFMVHGFIHFLGSNRQAGRFRSPERPNPRDARPELAPRASGDQRLPQVLASLELSAFYACSSEAPLRNPHKSTDAWPNENLHVGFGEVI